MCQNPTVVSYSDQDGVTRATVILPFEKSQSIWQVFQMLDIWQCKITKKRRDKWDKPYDCLSLLSNLSTAEQEGNPKWGPVIFLRREDGCGCLGRPKEWVHRGESKRTEWDADPPRISLSLFVEAYDEITKARERNKKNIFGTHIRPGSLFSYLTGKIEFMGFWVEHSLRRFLPQ